MNNVIGCLGVVGMILLMGGNDLGLLFLIPSLIKLVVIDLAFGGKDVIL
jgi:hypothetical protein